MGKLLRRLFWLALLSGAGYAAWTTWQRKHEPAPTGPPVWPPLDDRPATSPTMGTGLAPDDAAEGTVGETADDRSVGGGDGGGDGDGDGDGGGGGDGGGDAPEDAEAATSTATPAFADAARAGGARWVAPVDGRCPDGYPIKGNDNSGIYHVPGGRFYERTVPERCYANEDHAIADGYRRAKA